MPHSGIGGADESRDVSLRDLLAGYDRRVKDDLVRALAATTGTERVQYLYRLRSSIAVHDSVLGSALCPLLDDLPDGTQVADRLRAGCRERAELLEVFHSLSEGTDARNVYPVFGEEIERVLVELADSFNRHADDETTRVGELLGSSAADVDPVTVATKLAIESDRAPTRVHPWTERHPRSSVLRGLYRWADKLHDWNDSHHGWPSPGRPKALPVRPRPQLAARPPSIPDLLAGYDNTVHALIDELDHSRENGPEWAAAAYRLGGAVAVHDAVLGGVVCHLLESVPEGRGLAARLRDGCRQRGELLEAWSSLVKQTTAESLYRDRTQDAQAIITPLISSFRVHQTRETAEVADAVERMRERSWPWRGTAGTQTEWVWPNPEPDVLAVHMALWGDNAPVRPHRFMAKHPANRALRGFYRRMDHIRDRREARHGWPTLT